MSNNGTHDLTLDEIEETEKSPYEYYVDSEGNYCFRCSDGTVLLLKGIPQVIYQRFLDAWKISNPQPKPPQHEIKRAKKMVWVDNTHDDYFKSQMDNWTQDQAMAVQNFVISRVVLNTPPPDYEPYEEIVELYGDTMNEKLLKIMWVEGKLATGEEQQAFVEAAMSITLPTEGAIAESTARFPSDS